MKKTAAQIADEILEKTSEGFFQRMYDSLTQVKPELPLPPPRPLTPLFLSSAAPRPMIDRLPGLLKEFDLARQLDKSRFGWLPLVK
jgi:hypothetical protein